jgi:hypothetical protein
MSQEPQKQESPEPLTVDEMKADLEKAGYGDLLKRFLAQRPDFTEQEAVEHFRAFY